MPSVQDYSPQEPKPLGGYAILLAVFHGLVAVLVAMFRRSRKGLPENIPASDLALMSISTFKLSRIITKDKVTAVVRAPFTQYEEDGGPAEVKESARGTGLQRAVGELLACPYCIGQWVATGLLALYVWQPQVARTASSVFVVATGADALQQGWIALDKTS